MLNSLVEYGGKFQEMIDGRDDDAPFEEIAGGAKIASLFKKDFEKSLKDIDVLADISPRQLRNIIKNSSGLNGGSSFPMKPFRWSFAVLCACLSAPLLRACKRFTTSSFVRPYLSRQT